ncbi:hypothetical protein C0991_012580 [Blastosporella zonata]|nr:hypothetical protein C0991_012580 [Blastosporella zonata]
MDIIISKIPSEADEKTVQQALERFLYSNRSLFPSTYPNWVSKIRVHLDQPRQLGKGLLALPTQDHGRTFLSLFAFKNLSMKVLGREIFFSQKARQSRQPLPGPANIIPRNPPPPKALVDAQFHDSDLRVVRVQIGVFYRPMPFKPATPRSFSAEWEQEYIGGNSAWLEIGAESLRIKAPLLEESDIYPSSDSQKPKRRVRYVHDGLTRVAPYAHHVRLILFKDPATDVIDVLAHRMMHVGLNAKKIIRFSLPAQIDAVKGELYSDRRLRELRNNYRTLPWAVVFQLESLLRNGVFNTMDLLHLLPAIKVADISPLHTPQAIVAVLRELSRAVITGTQSEPPVEYFKRVCAEIPPINTAALPDTFLCQYITFTPTRAFLRGPYPTGHNRVIRKYAGYEDRFIRVSFRDEGLLPYRESRDVDLRGVVQEGVGDILRNGFDVGGRHFEFLAYSLSGFRNHSVWFMSPFLHPQFGSVTPYTIRSSLGDFEKVLTSPSMYGARLAQAFTTTVPTVQLGPGEWEDMEDMGSVPYQFTDGGGTMSKSLGREVWTILVSTGLYDGLEPSTYQIRFKEYKGVVTVDEHFDEAGGIRMRLRLSMKKFVTSSEAAELEIVKAFDRPHGCYLNRPFVSVLENLGVPADAFVELQDKAVADVINSDQLCDSFPHMMDDRRLAQNFRLSSIIKQAMHLAHQSSPGLAARILRNSFIEQVSQVIKSTVLQDMKYGSRVPIPGSYLLVGVPDEGPAYEKAGRTNVYYLQPNHIYACIHYPGDPEQTWLSGPCLISRSPVVHPGDVQKVYAIGKPPNNMFCAFVHLKNVVVLPSVGARSLASCLGGGDLDGDTFSLIFHEPLFPPKFATPAKYPYCEPRALSNKRTCVGQDVADFVVESMITEGLGQLSDRLLDVLDIKDVGRDHKNWIMLADLCAEAADYPKRGNPVTIDYNQLPRSLSRKPDWRSTGSHEDSKGYYTSTSALGRMFRSLSIEDVTFKNLSDPCLNFDSISPDLRSLVEGYIIPSDGNTAELMALFRNDGHLSEAEVVAGTILSRTGPKYWRKQRIEQMNVHVAALVADVRRALHMPCDIDSAECEDLLRALGKGWQAWSFASSREAAFGVGSFSFIALGVVLDCDKVLTKNGLYQNCRLYS